MSNFSQCHQTSQRFNYAQGNNYCTSQIGYETSTTDPEFVTACNCSLPDDDKTWNEFAISEVTRFIRECASKAGCSQENSQLLACMLVGTDCMGIKSEGLNRLSKYITELKQGVINGKSKPEIDFDTAGLALIDGNNGLGHIIAKYAMQTAILKAKVNGAALVTCTNSNHFGAASLYGLQAVEQNCIGLTFASGTPMMVTPGSSNVGLGCNPISIAGPAAHDEYFNLDVATTAASLGKIELKMQNEEDLPVGWAQKSKGDPAIDPLKVLDHDQPKLVPLGSPSFGHLGFGLALMVEILSGILSGSKFGPYMKKYNERGTKQNIGYTFMAINPNAFAPDFEYRFWRFLKNIRSLPSRREDRILLSGDPEIEAYKETLKCQFLRYNDFQISECGKIADELDVVPLRPRPLLKQQKEDQPAIHKKP